MAFARARLATACGRSVSTYARGWRRQKVAFIDLHCAALGVTRCCISAVRTGICMYALAAGRAAVRALTEKLTWALHDAYFHQRGSASCQVLVVSACTYATVLVPAQAVKPLPEHR